MSRLGQRGFSETDVRDFKKRANEPHTVKWRANVVRFQGGEEEQLYDHLPIVGGTLSLDSSDPTRRHLTLEVAGVGRLPVNTPHDPLAPFGQVVKLWMTIDRRGGGWFDWLKMFEGPVQTTTSEWPSQIQTVEAVDYSQRVDDFLFVKKKSYSKRTIHSAIKEIAEDALPDKVFVVHSEDSAKNIHVEPHTIAEAGAGRWEFAVQIAQARGFECFFDWSGSLIIRHDITNDDNETVPSTGPDVGTTSHPIAVIRDGEGGNLVALTQSVTREGGLNGVQINVHETITQKIRDTKKQEAATGNKQADLDDVMEDGNRFPPDDPDKPDPEVPMVPNPAAGDGRVNVTIAALADGPTNWGGRYGRQNLVMERNVKRITDSVISTQKRRAKRILHRRGGVIRTMDLDAVGLYWCEPDDRVSVEYDGRVEAHFIASIEFDISGQSPARIRTRSVATDDPGSED